ADLYVGKRSAHAAGVAQDEVSLELGALAGWNDDVLELPHPGRDPVDRLDARRQPVDKGARGAERPRRGRREPHLLAAPRDGLDSLERVRTAVEIDHGSTASGTRQPLVSSR